MGTVNQSNNIRIAKNTIILYVRMMVLIIISLYSSRVVLSALGIEDFGIYNIVGGIVTMIGFLNGTLSTASSRYITVALGKGIPQKMREVFSSILLLNIFLSLIVLAVSETVGLWFFFNKLVIPANRISAAFWTYQISIFTVILNIISVPYNAAIIAHEKMKAFAYITIFDAIAKLSIALLISVDLQLDKLVMYALLLFFVQVCNRLIYGRYCVANFDETHFSFFYDKKLYKEMAGFIGWSAYGSLVSVGFTQGLNILINLFFGPSINAARGIAVQVQNVINSFVSNFQTAVNPQLIKNVAVGNYHESQAILVSSSKFSFFLLCILGIPVIVFADYILSLWLINVPEYTVVFVRIMLVICIFQSLANPIRVVNQAEGHIKKFQKYECTYLALIVPLSYIALKIGFAAYSVFLIQLFIEITAQFIRIWIVLPKVKMNISEYLYEVYYRILPILIIPIIISYITLQGLPKSFGIVMVLCFVIEICILVLVYFIGLNFKEKQYINKFILKKIYSK